VACVRMGEQRKRGGGEVRGTRRGAECRRGRENCLRPRSTAKSVAVSRSVGDGFFCAQAGVGADLEFGEFFFARWVALAEERAKNRAEKS
jgi:hypothetical protein